MTDVQPTTETEQEASDRPRVGAPATRRSVLAGAGAVGATVVLTACGNSAGEQTPAPEPPAGSAAPGGVSGRVLAAASEVPVGGGVIKGNYVITQPAEGRFKAFDKTCTHQGCDVTEVVGAAIRCACHNSRFSIEDGSVKAGPASRPLLEQPVAIDGEDIVTA